MTTPSTDLSLGPPRKPRKTRADYLTAQGGLSTLFSEALAKQASRPNLYAYKPHDKQLAFHKSVKHNRLYIGGNRSGKTTGGIVEDCYWLMKRHPFRRLPLPEGPIRGRICSVDFTYGVAQIIIPEIKRWLPPSFLINGSWEDSFNKELRVLTLANGSTAELKSYDQDLEKFAGTSRHFTHYDEEPPLSIYEECEARLVDTDGSSWITMTPVEGMSWIHDQLYVPGVEGHKDISVVEVDMLDNPYIDKESSERFLSKLSPEDRKAREHGTFIQLGGKVFKSFSKETHVIPSTIPDKDWYWYVSIDHGYNNPTAILYHAVSPDGIAITFDCIYEREKTVEEFADMIIAKNNAYGKVPDFYVGDPAMKQRSGITGTSIIQEYAKNGIFVAEGNNDVPTGVNKMQQYLAINESTKKPSWFITENCGPLIGEMGKLRWKTYSSKKVSAEHNRQEQIHKKDDHACDSARYFFSFLPDLAAQGITLQGMSSTNPMGAPLSVSPVGNVDRNVPKKAKWKTSAVGTDIQGFEYE